MRILQTLQLFIQLFKKIETPFYSYKYIEFSLNKKLLFLLIISSLLLNKIKLFGCHYCHIVRLATQIPSKYETKYFHEIYYTGPHTVVCNK